uniref:ATR-interacting protein mus304 n=1 Tax=Anopheles atroparvus TaxID=41427 RepID=A0AAG5D9Y6_ANOAO
MSKRLGHFQLKQPVVSKKPKLDIEIIPSQQYNPQPSTSTGNWKPKVANNAAKMDALWGDEDDEFIVLASQAVEEMYQQSQAFSSSNMADVTFGKFSRNVQSSTQAIIHPTSSVSKPPTRASDKQVAELFADGEDEIFTEKFDDNYENIENKLDNYFDNEFDEDFNLDEFRQEGQKPLVNGRIEPPKPTPEPEFKVPVPMARASTSITSAMSVSVVKSSTVVGAFKSKTASGAPAATTSSLLDATRTDQTAQENATKKLEHAKDIQVKFLTKRLEQCEKQVESMQRDYSEALEKAKIKDGEVSTLRYKLKTVNDTIEQQRMDKIRETETIQKEWVERQKELEKIIAAQTAELNFKEMELMNLRMKRSSHPKRTAEVRESQTEPPGSEQKRVTEQSFILCDILSGVFISSKEEPLMLDPHVFVVSTEVAAQGGGNRKYFHSSRSDTIIAHQLVALQTCLSQLVSQPDRKSSVKLPAHMLPAVVRATVEGFSEITQYCQRMMPALAKDTEFTTRSLNGGHPKDARQARAKSRMDQVRSTSIFQREELFPGEQARVIRRFLAVLGLFCRISNELVDETLFKERRIQQLARDVKLVSNASALHAHHGMITGAAALLKGISFRLVRLKTFAEHGSQLIALFRSIVLCQIAAPSSMHELSEFLRRLSHRTDDAAALALINQLCRSHDASSRAQTAEKYRMKTISFSEETCSLQMYANLLESSIRQHVPYERWRLELLLANADNTISFLRNILVPSPVVWVKNFIVSKGSHECNLCHIRIVSAFLMLLHRMLQCWHQRTVVERKDIEKLYRIARNGTLLLYDLFGTAYCSKLLLLGGDAVKYRLRIIYDWFREHQGTFQFQPVHVKALERLDLRLLIYDPLKSNQEVEDIKVEPVAGTAAKTTFQKELNVGFFKNKYCYK